MAGQFKQSAKVIDAVLTKTQGGGDALVIGFEILSDDQGMQGDRLEKWCTFGSAVKEGSKLSALDMTVRVLRALGWQPEEHNWDIPGMVDGGAILDAEATLVCEVKDYKGSPRTEIVFVNSPQGARESMAPEEAAAFGATLRKKLMTLCPPKGGAKAQPAKAPAKAPARTPARAAAPAADAEEPDLDEIPF